MLRILWRVSLIGIVYTVAFTESRALSQVPKPTLTLVSKVQTDIGSYGASRAFTTLSGNVYVAFSSNTTHKVAFFSEKDLSRPVATVLHSRGEPTYFRSGRQEFIGVPTIVHDDIPFDPAIYYTFYRLPDFAVANQIKCGNQSVQLKASYVTNKKGQDFAVIPTMNPKTNCIVNLKTMESSNFEAGFNSFILSLEKTVFQRLDGSVWMAGIGDWKDESQRPVYGVALVNVFHPEISVKIPLPPQLRVSQTGLTYFRSSDGAEGLAFGSNTYDGQLANPNSGRLSILDLNTYSVQNSVHTDRESRNPVTAMQIKGIDVLGYLNNGKLDLYQSNDLKKLNTLPVNGWAVSTPSHAKSRSRDIISLFETNYNNASTLYVIDVQHPENPAHVDFSNYSMSSLLFKSKNNRLFAAIRFSDGEIQFFLVK